MSAQRYERLNADDGDNNAPHLNTTTPNHYSNASIPSSPPPSFRSRASSIASRRHSAHDRQPLVSDADRTLAETFDSPSDDETEDERTTIRLDDRQRAMSGRPVDDDNTTTTAQDGQTQVERRVTQLPVFATALSATVRRQIGGHDGVFANMAAKPGPGGEEMEEKPPTYEQAAADAAPPYWETTILSPGYHNPDDVFIDGLPVGSFFSFLWNGMISMSFQLVGFLLTYLLHTTHAAKNGSKAGLGITLIQFGFSIKSSGSVASPGDSGASALPSMTGADFVNPPSDPNSHVFDPNVPLPPGGGVGAMPGTEPVEFGGMKTGDWFAYAMMIVGWFILIKAVSDYVKARRHEQLVLQSPNRGLNVAVVAEGERPETSV